IEQSLAIGVYSVASISPAGWYLSNANCSDGSSPSSVSLSPGDVVTCYFLYLQRGYISIDVVLPGSGPEMFNFTLSGGDLSSPVDVSLDDASPPFVSNALTPGQTYGITPDGLAGFTLVSATCS